MSSSILRNAAILSAISVGLPAFAAVDRPTFSRDIAPIIMENCATCHRPNEIAPMSLLSFAETRPWAKSIRQAVLTREMPPWDADPAIGHFSNDISLGQDDIDTIVRWVDQGGVEGDPADMPAVPHFPEGWRMGEPDLIIDLGAIDVPAAGEDLFVNKALKLELPENQWIRGVEVQVGNKNVLHHLVAFKGYVQMGSEMKFINDVPPEDRDARDLDVLSIWAAGTPPTDFPVGMGHPIEKDQVISFNMHLHPYGTAATDRSKIGLYFGKGKLEKKITTGFAINTGILVPAGSSDYTERAQYVFGQDVRIISFFPHLHVRGQGMRYTLTYPDGRSEDLLNVPRYDFNWQWIYQPVEPIEVPKGSRLEIVANYDNSIANEANPDASVDVIFGDNTTDEMLIGFFDYVPVKGVKPKRVRSQEKVGPLLALHPPEEMYELAVDARLLTLAWGLHVPEAGNGTLYFVEGKQTLTMTLRDIVQTDSEVIMNGRFPTDAANTIPMSIRADKGADGSLSGGLYVGRYYEPGKGMEPIFTFTGKRVADATSTD